MTLEKGMYVRTKSGTIGILGNEITPLRYEIINSNNQLYCEDNVRCDNIKKTSNNITNLLKVKDIITIFSDLHDSLGKQTLFIENANHLKHIKIGLENGYYHLIDVLTKEQFEEMKYKI